MAEFDIPLRVKFSVKLDRERRIDGLTIRKDGNTFYAEAEVNMSIRTHNWIAQNCGFFQGFADHPDCKSAMPRDSIASLHGFVANVENCGPFVGDTRANSNALLALARVHTAQGYCKNNFDTTYSIIVPQEDQWKLREALKFADGTYTPCPVAWKNFEFYSGSILDPHSPDFNFAHISTGKDGMIAFTENAQKGAADVQKRMKPGKFIRQYFGELLNERHGENRANAIIADMAAQFGNAVKEEDLLYASTPEEIEWVYTHGPSSCMAHGVGDYDTRDWGHPTRIFGAGDLKVAYIKRNGRVTARALIWPEKKVMTRIYGDATRIEPLLKREGYKFGGAHCLDGAKLVKQKHGTRFENGYAVPYVDGQSWARDDGDHLVIDNAKGVIYLLNTCGSAEGGTKCAICDRLWRSGEMMNYRNSPNTRPVRACNKCWEKNTWECALTGDRYGKDYPKVRMADGTFWAEGTFRHHGFTCAYDGKNYPTDGTIRRGAMFTQKRRQSVPMWDGTRWFIDNFEKHGKTYNGINYSLNAYERKICEDMGQSELPLAEAAYAKLLEEQRIAKEEALRKEREEAEKKERERRNTRRRTLYSIRKRLAQQGITISAHCTDGNPYFRYIPPLNSYMYVSSGMFDYDSLVPLKESER